MSAPVKTLRGALNQIQDMLSGKPYSEDLWNVLTGLRGPDSRDRKLKSATTVVIRDAAFPKHPCSLLSFFGRDRKDLVARRKKMYAKREDANHFREHVKDAFESLNLDLYDTN